MNTYVPTNLADKHTCIPLLRLKTFIAAALSLAVTSGFPGTRGQAAPEEAWAAWDLHSASGHKDLQ